MFIDNLQIVKWYMNIFVLYSWRGFFKEMFNSFTSEDGQQVVTKTVNE